MQNSIKISRLFLAASVLAALFLSPVGAMTPTDAVVTDTGQVQRAMAGFYGDLFPGGSQAPGTIRALALDLQGAEGSQRLLVPSSETWRPERSPSVLWDSASASTIVLWLSGTGSAGNFTVEFVSRSEETWGEVGTARYGTGGPVVFGSEPDFFVSSRKLSFETEDSTITVSRKVVHVVWREAATESLLYMPLVFVDGQYVGWSDVVTLSEVLTKSHEDSEDPSPGMPESLRSLFLVQESDDGLLLAVADPAHGRLGVVAVELLPMELTALADSVRDAVLDSDETGPGGLQALSDGIRAQIIAVGQTVHLNPAIAEYTAVRVSDWLRNSDPDLSLEDLATGARDESLEVSSSVLAQTITDPSDPDGVITVLDLDDFLSDDGEGSRLSDLVKLDVRMDVAAPEIDEAGIQAMIGSEGNTMILSWPVEDGAGLRYTEHRQRDGWSEQATLHLSESLGLDQAHDLLRRRLP